LLCNQVLCNNAYVIGICITKILYKNYVNFLYNQVLCFTETRQNDGILFLAHLVQMNETLLTFYTVILAFSLKFFNGK